MGWQKPGPVQYQLAIHADTQHQALAAQLQPMLESESVISSVQVQTPETASVDDCNDVVIRIAHKTDPDWVATYRDQAPCTMLIAITPQADTSTPGVPTYRTDTPLEVLAQQIITGIALIEQQKRSEASYKLAQINNQTVEPGGTLNALLVLLRGLVPYRAINLTMLVEQFLYVPAHHGYTDADRARLVQPRRVLDTNWLKHILTSGEAGYVPNIPKTLDTLFPWSRAWAGVPIKKQGEIISILNIDADAPWRLRSLHIDRLTQLAPQIAVLLETLQLYETLEQTNNLLRAISRQNSFLFTPLSNYTSITDLCQVIVESVLTSFNATDCGILLVQPGENKLSRCARAGDYVVQAETPLYVDGPGLVAEAIRTESVIYAPNVNNHPKYLATEPRTKTELVIPMPSQNGIIGVLDLQSTHYEAFSPQDIESLTAFGGHAGAAIMNLITYQKQRDYSRGLEERVRERTAALNASKERVEAILNRTSDALVLMKPDGRIEQVNSAFNNMFGVQPDAVFQWPLQELVHKKHHADLEAAIGQVQHAGGSVTLELKMRTPDKRTFEAELTLSTVRFERPTATAHGDMVGSIRDISKHKLIQSHLEQLLKSERELSNLKSRFILTVSHEFRTPMTVIMSSSDLLQSRGDKMTLERRKKHLKQIKDQVQHMETMLSNALLVGQAEQDKLTYQPKPLNLTELARTAIDALNRGASTPQIVFSHADEDVWLNADATLIRQIINNLLTNAIKYAPDTNAVYLSLHTEGDSVVIQVKDNGIGIAKEEQEALFQPFYRAQNANTTPGSGLGLSIVQYAVQQHGGSVHIDSRPGEGSTFYVTLPR